MTSILLLVLIYLAFISLGLPDSILGGALPAIQLEWNLPLSAGGLLSMIVVGSTIVSSFLSGHLIKRFGTGKITFLSCILTGSSLLGYSMVPSFYWLLMLAVPLGLGGGAVDTALNNYVALNFKARHMNWLHSFWGVGATLGPLIMSHALLSTSSWRSGYRTISFVQLSLALVLLVSLPLWKIPQQKLKKREERHSPVKDKQSLSLFRIPGVNLALMTMFLYCTVESSVGLWGSSFLVQTRGASLEKAASWIALYYGGITLGRFLSGILSIKLNNTQMIRYGGLTALSGILLFLLPLPSFVSGSALVLLGLGLSPIFPAMLHETPHRFGSRYSQVLIGYQMGFAYMGSAFMPPLLGVVLQNIRMAYYPFIILTVILIMLFVSRRLTSGKGRTIQPDFS